MGPDRRPPRLPPGGWWCLPLDGDAAEREGLFVTVDDLDAKPWLGDDRTTVFTALSAAYATAVDLRRSHGLRFVVAPIPSASGSPCVRLEPRYALALFPFLPGVPGRWGEQLNPLEREELVTVLAELHRSAPTTRSVLPRPQGVTGRALLEEALAHVARPWDAGPLSEGARGELANGSRLVAGWLTELDALTARLADGHRPVVVTHGEPHPGNIIRAAGQLALVDWDTVALGPPERDLWMFDDGAWAEHERLTGYRVDPEAVRFYGLVWALGDVASFVRRLRAPHMGSADDKRALVALRQLLALEEPAPYGVPVL